MLAASARAGGLRCEDPMAGFLSDVRFGMRALKASPSYLVLAVLCLGLGIGASTMTFTVINDALLKPLGALDAAGLVAMGEVRQNAPSQWWPVSWLNLVDWQAALGARAELGALRAGSFDVGSAGSGVRAEGAYATGNLFAVLGVAPVLGRSLQPADDTPGGEPVVVIGEPFWRERLGGDRAVLGRALEIDGVPHTIVGVVPALLDVGVPTAVRSARIWLPLRAAAQPAARGERSLFVIGRLLGGASMDSVGAQLRGAASELAAAHPEDAGWSVGVGPLGGSAIGSARRILLLSMGAAALVLLIACANIANVTLAHATRRRHEFAIRTAIGAAPLRIARQLLAESVLVATLGALLGLAVARLGLDVLVRFYEADSLAPAVLPIDTRSLTFTIAITFLTTVLVGLFPAWEAARAATRARIAESGFGAATARTQDGLRRGLVVGQIAAALVLLVGAALLGRSFMNLLGVDGGIDAERVTSIRAEVADPRATPAGVARYVESMLAALAAVPGVEAAASINNMLPLRGGGARSGVSTAGSTADPSARPVVAYTGVTPGFFATLGIPLLRGRSFQQNEQPGRVAVVNQALAKLLWPNQDPVGRQLTLDADRQRGPITVIGVSGDVLTWDSNGDKPLPTAYLDAESFDAYPVFFFVRTRGAGQRVGGESIARALAAVDVRFKRVVVTPMQQVAREPFWRQQMFSLWFVAFGAVALTLTAVGVYGVLAYLVWQRWHEIGIRMALGAGRRTVLLTVVRQGAVLVAIGIGVGLAGAFVLARAMRGLLFGVAPFDPALFFAATAFLAVTALVASVAPALRASRVDPNVLLKSQR
jgi:putative ABC transport system permease protein